MSEELANATGAPIPVHIGGQDILLSPLTVGDMGIVDRTSNAAGYAEADRRIDALKKHAVDTPENKTKVLFDLFGDLDSGRATSRYLVSNEGTALVAWLSAKHEKPDIQLQWMRDNMTYAAMSDVQATIDRMSFPKKKPTARDEHERGSDTGSTVLESGRGDSRDVGDNDPNAGTGSAAPTPIPTNPMAEARVSIG